MSNYVIFRHGSNAANQSLCPVAIVATVEAKNRKEAKASEEYTDALASCYFNQFLELKPFSSLNSAEREELRTFQEDDALTSCLIPGECQICGKIMGNFPAKKTHNLCCEDCCAGK